MNKSKPKIICTQPLPRRVQPDGPTKPGAVIYIRAQSVAGDSKRDARDVSAQHDACSARAHALGATVERVFIEHGALDGSARRTELEQLLRWVEVRPTRYVILHEISRLGTNVLENLSVALTVEAAGAELILAGEDFDDSPAGRFIADMMRRFDDARERRQARPNNTKGGSPCPTPLPQNLPQP